MVNGWRISKGWNYWLKIGKINKIRRLQNFQDWLLIKGSIDWNIDLVCFFLTTNNQQQKNGIINWLKPLVPLLNPNIVFGNAHSGTALENIVTWLANYGTAWLLYKLKLILWIFPKIPRNNKQKTCLR